MNIKSAKFVISNSRVDKCPTHQLPEYAFIGRSNVGKSSLINMLTAQKGLAMTSATPGKTLLINHFIVNDSWFLVDLPGYGYAKRGLKQQQQIKRIIEEYILLRSNLTSLFVLIDSRLAPQKIDIDFISWLGEHNIPFALVFTKSDKLSSAKLKINIQQYTSQLLESWDELPPVFVTSSTSRQGREEILNYIDNINRTL